MLIPPKHSFHGLAIIAYISGALLMLAGACIVLKKKIRLMALLLGIALLLIFCFYFIPYQLLATSDYMQLISWDNAEKELALSAGAFIIAGCFPQNSESSSARFLPRLISFGTILFCITIISFGIDHFLYAKGVAEYIPSWIPNKIFWAYFAGAALLGSGIAIIFKIRHRLFATLLGSMIFIWFIILHIPKAVASPFADMGSEVTSAFLALAYSGIAFVIAGISKHRN
jgi:uncharacterized membrane protein YjfL (UPF0719 family)